MSAGAGGELTRDGLLGGRVVLEQPRRGYRAATDPVFLAAAVPAVAGERVLDLGCGAGAAALCLAARVPGLGLHGLELQPDFAELARRNATANGVALTVHLGDVAAMPRALRALHFDHVITNPPFFAAGQGTGPADPGRHRAEREGAVTLASWIAAGLRRLRPGGLFTLIQRTERLPEILAALSGPAGGVTLQPLAARRDRPAGRVIVQARKGSRAPLRLNPPFVIHDAVRHLKDSEDYTLAAIAVLRECAQIPINLDAK
ncbi:MAG TPA: methyltransferase [Paracoccaceae bacterium]|nr:methyltransferase [Paracoccaceae bacterium]